MCNCGSKRQALNSYRTSLISQQANNGGGKPISATVPNGPVKIRYTGNSNLNIRSTVSRHVYSFSAVNRQLVIRPEDVPMLSSFSELVQDN